MPRWLILALSVLAALALIPVACIARARATHSPLPAIHLIQDMGRQPKYKLQQENPLFADDRADRPPVPGTVARGHLHADDRYWRGMEGGSYLTEFPVPVTLALLHRGRERFDIYCSPCHGLAGSGDGMVAKRADALQEGTWVPPANLHTEPYLSRPPGQLFDTIAHGVRNMPAYGPQIPVADRWAIVAYVKALQLSQDARIEDVPPELRPDLR